MEQFAASGGSDILESGLRKRIDFDKYNVNLILSRCQEEQIVDGKFNILWQHLNYNEPLTNGMANRFFKMGIDAFVYVSHWQYEKFRYVYHAPVENAHIIKNAIEPVQYVERDRNEKIRLIYTSTPFRGLDILLDAFELLNRDDIELQIFSSTIIYGSGYDNAYRSTYEPLFERADSMRNVLYMGYAPNNEVIKALQKSHIFAYPSMFEETCCLSMIEAGAAGCRMVTHNLGALPETGAEFARYVPIKINKHQIVESYASAINEEINSYWDNTELLKTQSDYYNKFYCWDKIQKEWENILSKFQIN